jgi:poly(A) polymerase
MENSFPFLLENDENIRLLELLRSWSIEGRFVGGCVRDSLLKRPISDIDIAVKAVPKMIMKKAEESGIRAIPTGQAFGTVTLHVQGKNFELTSLRKDIQTDGRHAKVEYTPSWEDDAARRDFTINALYLDEHGQLYDYFHGVHDLEKGCVRFIGKAADRIQEDYLRILRYYRFLARFSTPLAPVDKASMQAVQKYAPLLRHLSAERIQAEIGKILSEDSALPIIQLMNQHDVWQILIGVKAQDELFERLVRWEQQIGKAPYSPLLRLFSLFPLSLAFFKKRWRLSRKETNLLEGLTLESACPFSSENCFRIRHQKGETLSKMWFLYRACQENLSAAPPLLDFFQKLSNAPFPPFPLTGADLLAAGFAPGPEIGRRLKACELWWISSLGKKTKAECLSFAETV